MSRRTWWWVLWGVVLFLIMLNCGKAQAHEPSKPLDASYIEDEWAEAYLEHFDTFEPTGPIYLAPATYRGMGSSSIEQWRPLVALHFPSDQVDHALEIMACESGGNPDAKNPRSTARGLFQILASLWAPHFGVSYDDLYMPDLNVELARKIYDIQGWDAWTCH
jgi:soluble lytic murein transglycosylase-like protein